MKLLVFTPSYPPRLGGLETHAFHFNTYMAARHEVARITVFTPRIPDTSPVYWKSKKIEIYRFPAFELIPNYPIPKFWTREFWQLYRRLMTTDYDIVISRTRFFTTSLLALIYARITKHYWCHIEHGSDYVQLNNPLTAWFARLYDHTFGRLVFRSSNQNIAISQAVKSFINQFDIRDVPVIYRGVEVERIETVSPNEHIRQRHPTKCLVIFVGRLIDGKGVLDLLEALCNLDSSQFHCLIVGDGPQKEQLEQRVKDRNLGSMVTFLGEKKLEDTIAFVKSADIFVNPSYTEGLPTAVIEAALCKKCIIATHVGGTPEIVHDNITGFIVPPKDVIVLTEKLKYAYRHQRQRRAMGNRAYKEVKELFSWQSCCDAYLRLFTTLPHNER